MVLNCQKQESWELLGSLFCELDLCERSADLRTWVELIGEQLAG
jgi:hypothetical protein